MGSCFILPARGTEWTDEFKGKSNINWFGNISEGCDIFKSPLILVLGCQSEIPRYRKSIPFFRPVDIYHPTCWVLINMIFFLVCLTAHNWCCCLMMGLSKRILPCVLQGMEAFISSLALVVVLKSVNIYEYATTSIFFLNLQMSLHSSLLLDVLFQRYSYNLTPCLIFQSASWFIDSYSSRSNEPQLSRGMKCIFWLPNERKISSKSNYKIANLL